MVRTQIQLTEEQAARVRRIAAERRVSMAEVIRDTIDRALAAPGWEVSPAERIRRAIAVAGRYRSGGTDGAAQHDRHLAEAYRQ